MKLTIALLITVILSGCSMYKTREFVQQEEVKIENWDIKVFMSAFLAQALQTGTCMTLQHS